MENLFGDIINEIKDQTQEPWEKEWKGMPEFKQLDMEPWKSVVVQFESEKDMLEFGRLVNQKITFKTPSIWFPKVDPTPAINKLWVDES